MQLRPRGEDEGVGREDRGDRGAGAGAGAGCSCRLQVREGHVGRGLPLGMKERLYMYTLTFPKCAVCV